ncbi:DinB family protein [Aureibacillus halotolerans]|nr:DinB family protein [Aureibacillus halotolerans]
MSVKLFKDQYAWIRMTRENTFRCCELVQDEEYRQELNGFGWASIRDLHVHVAECYQNWLAVFGLKEAMTIVTPEDVENVNDMRRVFSTIDSLVARFLEEFDGQNETHICGKVPWQKEEESLSVLWLYTHTTTHEFHHKGQIVSMIRQLGYTPIDTDLLIPDDVETYFSKK